MTAANIKPERVRVALVSHGFNRGGASASLEILIRYYRDHTLKIIFTRPVEEERINYLNNKYKEIEIVSSRLPAIIKAETCSTSLFEIIYNKLKGKYAYPRVFMELLEKYNPDYVVLNSTHLCWIIPYLVEKNQRTYVYVREQIKTRLNLSAMINRHCIEKATGAICISEFESKCIKNKNTHILYNSIYSDKEEVEKYKSESSEHNEYMKDSQIFVNMSQPAIQKGGFLIILAIWLLKIQKSVNNRIRFRKSENIKIRVYMLGAKSKGFNRTGMIWLIIKMLMLKNVSLLYRSLVAILGLKNEIILLDYIRETEEYLEYSKFYIRSSTTGDSWGRDIIEAMNSGKVCIVSGNSPFIENGKSGFVFKSLNILKLASIIRYCSEMELGEYLAISKEAKKAIREKCSNENYSRSLTQALKL